MGSENSSRMYAGGVGGYRREESLTGLLLQNICCCDTRGSEQNIFGRWTHDVHLMHSISPNAAVISVHPSANFFATSVSHVEETCASRAFLCTCRRLH